MTEFAPTQLSCLSKKKVLVIFSSHKLIWPACIWNVNELNEIKLKVLSNFLRIKRVEPMQLMQNAREKESNNFHVHCSSIAYDDGNSFILFLPKKKNKILKKRSLKKFIVANKIGFSFSLFWWVSVFVCACREKRNHR